MMHRPSAAFAVVLFLCGTAGAASTDRAVRREGDRIFREGVRLIEQDRINEAMFCFERVLAYRQRPNVLWNLAASHINLGQRDLGLWFFERYLEFDENAQQSLRVQQAAAAIAAQDETITSREARVDLWGALAAAIVDAEDGGGAVALDDQIVFRADNPSPEAVHRAQLARDHGSHLFRLGLAAIEAGDGDQVLSFFERSLAYRNLRNAAYNIAASHLANGRRDLALFFFRLYVASVSALQQDGEVTAALQAIADAPATIRDENVYRQLSEGFVNAVDTALGTVRSPS